MIKRIYIEEDKKKLITFYSGISKESFNKYWKNKNLVDTLTNVSTNKWEAEGFSWDGTVIEIKAPLSSIIGYRKDNYYNDEDWKDVSKWDDLKKENLLYDYSMFLLNLFPYKDEVKIKLLKENK